MKFESLATGWRIKRTEREKIKGSIDEKAY